MSQVLVTGEAGFIGIFGKGITINMKVLPVLDVISKVFSIKRFKYITKSEVICRFKRDTKRQWMNL